MGSFLMRSSVAYGLYVHGSVASKLLLPSRPWGAVEIVPGLYLGNLSDSLHKEGLRKHGITHVVSVIQGIPSYPYTNLMVRAPGYLLHAHGAHPCTHTACRRAAVRCHHAGC